MTTRVSSIFTTLPECPNVIVGAPNLGSTTTPPPPPHPSLSRPPVCPRVIATFTGILALDTPQQNNPCQSDIGSPSVTEMRNEQILHNERQTTRTQTQGPTRMQYCASSHHNRNLPLILGRVKNVMKGYRPPTSDGTSHHTLTHLFLVYKLTKLYDMT